MSKTATSWLTEYLPPGSLPTNTSSSKKPAQEDNAMNRSVTNLWNMHKPTVATPVASTTASPIISGAATPLDVATPVHEELPPTPAPVTEASVPVESNKSKKRTKASKDTGSSAKRPKSKYTT